MTLEAEEDIFATSEGVTIELNCTISESADFNNADIIVNRLTECISIAKTTRNSEWIDDVGFEESSSTWRSNAPVSSTTSTLYNHPPSFC